MQPHEYLTIISEFRELLKNEVYPVYGQPGIDMIPMNKYGLNVDETKIIRDKIMECVKKLVS